jgi:hypothetical protein
MVYEPSITARSFDWNLNFCIYHDLANAEKPGLFQEGQILHAKVRKYQRFGGREYVRLHDKNQRLRHIM